jgi:hypothetical protein
LLGKNRLQSRTVGRDVENVGSAVRPQVAEAVRAQVADVAATVVVVATSTPWSRL